MAAPPVAEFEQVTKEYSAGFFPRRPLQAVKDISLRIEPGEVFGLLGPNRAGKTTLVKMLLTLCRPTRGRVTRLGLPASNRASLARVGYVHENQALPRYLTAAGLLQYYGALSLTPYEQVQKRVPDLLKRVGLADRTREPINRFSKGMVQRLSLAQALVNEPELLILDEPSEGLDLEGRRLVREVLGEQRQRGRTVLLISHVLTEVEQVCDRIGVLVEGRLVHVGPLANLVRDPAGPGRVPLEQALQRVYEGKRP